MKKFLKILGLSLAGLLLLVIIGGGLFIYKVKYGFNFYDRTAPGLPLDLGDSAILIFSKTNGFRHGEAIEASLPVFREIAARNSWKIFQTENGAVFNPDLLRRFRVVVWNNTSGKTLNESQRAAFREYLENGGGFLGIHAAGDFSHQWDWYEDQVIRARFSHHNIVAELETATLYLDESYLDDPVKTGLEPVFRHQDEWYVFYDNPRERGSRVVYTVDENTFTVSGNLPLLVTGKNWGMGEDHPIAWRHTLKEGRVVYSALGHHAAAFEDKNHQRLLENALRWAGRLE